MVNATHLFRNAQPYYRSNEAFWSSTFALTLMCATATHRPVTLPVVECVFHDVNGKHGEFRKKESLNFLNPLTLEHLCCGGAVTAGFIPDVGDVPNELSRLSPDIIIREDKKITLVEVKTVGHKISLDQKRNYDSLATFLRNCGYQAEIHYLVSAGHESERDFRLLCGSPETGQPANLLLWENVLKYFDAFEPRIPIMDTLGDLSTYYQNETSYMAW